MRSLTARVRARAGMVRARVPGAAGLIDDGSADPQGLIERRARAMAENGLDELLEQRDRERNGDE
jgi:hypothetical protein